MPVIYRYKGLIKFCLILFFSAILLSCQTNKEGTQLATSEFTVSISVAETNIDSLFIYESFSDRLLARIPLQSNQHEFTFPIESLTYGYVSSKQDDQFYNVMLKPGGKTRLRVDSSSFSTVDNLADSLVNYLQNSQNEAFGDHTLQNVIFRQDNPERVIQLFDSIKLARTCVLENYSQRLSGEEFDFLHARNEALVHSFLLHYGKGIKRYEPGDPFFTFIKEIDNKSAWGKANPRNLLLRYDLEFFTERDSLEDLASFLSYIEEKTSNNDLASFIKMYYMKTVMQSSASWKKHIPVFNTISVKEAMEVEKENPYVDLIKNATGSYFAVQQGKEAYDFVAYNPDRLPVKLSDFKGKLVYIDVWATWCGPCVEHRPNVLKLAEQYKDNENIAILMLSVDSSKEKWKKYIDKTNPANWGNEIMIEDGLKKAFGEKYLIKSIPKYLLIDSNGIIINANSPEPSMALGELIENELQKMELLTIKLK